MPGKLVPTVRTTYTEYEFVKALIQGWIANEKAAPTKEQIGVLWAQNALETGQSYSMWNNNIANVKYTASAGDVDYCMLNNVWEMVNGKKVMFQPPDPTTWFRSFPTLADGITFQINFLQNHRYRTAWTAVQAGNPAAFAHLLRLAGYYTAPESQYVAAINAFFNRFMKDSTFNKALADVQAPAPIVEPVELPLVKPVTDVVQPTVISNNTTIRKSSVWDTIIGFLSNLIKILPKLKL